MIGLVSLKVLRDFPQFLLGRVNLCLAEYSSSANPKYRALINIVCINFSELKLHTGNQIVGCYAMWIKGGYRSSNSLSIPGDEY